MLEAQARPRGRILHAERTDDGLTLRLDSGILRIEPQCEHIFRVRFSPEELRGHTGLGISGAGRFGGWQHREEADAVVLSTGRAELHIARKDSAIRWLDEGGRLLLAENGRAAEPFDAYPPAAQDGMVWQDIPTPDGIKRMPVPRSDVPPQTLYRTWLHFRFQDGERLYGLGQAEEGVLNLRGTAQYLHQANRKIAIPLLLSSRGWGILWATDSPAIFQDTQYGSYFFTEADEEMDYFFIAGRGFDEIIAGYRRLTGRAALPPRWVFGYLQSQERYESREELLATAAAYRARQIGLDCIVLDWCSWPAGQWGQKSFDPGHFGDMAGAIASLHAQKVRFMISIWPSMDPSGADYQAFAARGLLLPQSNVYDAFSAQARQLYWQQAEQGLFRHGVDAWWCDSSEPFTPEWTHREKPDPSRMYHEYVTSVGRHIPLRQANAYALAHARAIWEGQRDADSGKRVVNLTRSAWTGQQRYGTILWSGDTEATWETCRRQIAAGLNFCASGLPYWTLDIGGFFVKRGAQWFWNGDYDDGAADPRYGELFVRWHQLGAFLPVFRGHGTDVRRELWLAGGADPRFVEALTEAVRLRHRLLPYLYSLAGAAWLDDSTLMRLLAFDFPEDERALDTADEFMLGPALLVCPVTQPMFYDDDRRPVSRPDCRREVYLPGGTDWYDFHTGKRWAGGQTILADAPLERIPLFVRAGSVLPLSRPLTCAAAYRREDVTLQVYPGADGVFRFYDDAGDGDGWERGDYLRWALRWDDRARQLSVQCIHAGPAGDPGWQPPVTILSAT